jgi:methylthioribose-1-phosphate isomerase
MDMVNSSTESLPLLWRDDHLAILDQRLLPQEVHYIEARDYATVTTAIRDLAVRGAPAIGIAAAYGVVLAARALDLNGPIPLDQMQTALDEMEAARPTAVNLAWALRHMAQQLDQGASADDLLREALRIHQDERDNNATMACYGAELIEPGSRVLTVCNTGGLATGGSGTALAVIVEAWRQQRLVEAFSAETRPWFQGARLTTWELQNAGVKHRLVVDSAVPWLMKNEGIDWVIVGADRVVANGDAANKIGTYAAALAAKAHGAKTMVVIPTTTLDLNTAEGSQIPIEERSAEEITAPGGRPLAPEGTRVWNPVFDVTPAHLIDALVTEKGVIANPDREKIAALMA